VRMKEKEKDQFYLALAGFSFNSSGETYSAVPQKESLLADEKETKKDSEKR
jgi:hypothetical protein